MTAEDSINKAFLSSFEIFKKNYVTLIIGTLIALLLMILIITIPPMIFGIYYMCIQLMNGKRIKVSDVFKGFDYFFLSWGIMLISLIGILIGLALLVIPGILLMIMLQYAVPVAIIEKKGVFASISRSYELAKKNFTFSIAFWILLGVLNSLGAFTRIGTLLTIPFTATALSIAAAELGKKKA